MRRPRPSCRTFRSLPAACLLLGALAVWIAGPPTDAAPDAAGVCESWAVQAAQEAGVPADVLRAITLVESGIARDGRFGAWPWAVNRGGEGHWFPDRGQASAYVRAQIAAGTTNIDIGCFQLNYRWHGAGFRSVDEMFDPARNARYAAGFLAGLYGELNSWEAAAKAYHSRSPELGDRYFARLSRHLERGTAPVARVAAAVVRYTGAPGSLWVETGPVASRSGGAPALASLVPAGGFASTRREN